MYIQLHKLVGALPGSVPLFRLIRKRMRPFAGFAVRKRGTLESFEFSNWETRNESTLQLIADAVEQFQIADFEWILVNTGDRDTQHKAPFPIYSYSTSCGRFETCCPDFVFDHWRQTGLDDFEEQRKRLRSIDAPALEDKLGWRGANMSATREKFAADFTGDDFDVQLIVWDRTDPNRLQAKNFVSFEDQVRRWRFLIDIEGLGYSARLKLLLSANRVVFIQKRPWEEFFFRDLEPWVHYAPVAPDFSDLRDNLARLRSDPSLEASIIAHARAYADVHLTRAAAVTRWADILVARAAGRSGH